MSNIVDYFLVGMFEIAVFIVGRIISWRARKPWEWGVRECIRVVALWNAAEVEREKRRYD